SCPCRDGWGRRRSPLFGARESSIDERLVQVQLSPLVQVPRQTLQSFFQLAVPRPLRKTAMAGLVWRIFLRHLPPLCSGTQHPEHAIQHGTGLMPWAAAIICPPHWPQHRLHHGPLFIVQFPASCQGASRIPRAAPGSHETALQIFMRLVLARWEWKLSLALAAVFFFYSGYSAWH